MLTFHSIHGDNGLSSFRVVSNTSQTGASPNGPTNDGERKARRDAPQGGGNESASGVKFCGTDWTAGEPSDYTVSSNIRRCSDIGLFEGEIQTVFPLFLDGVYL